MWIVTTTLPGLRSMRDVGDGRVSKARLEILPQELVLAQQRREITVGVPARLPRFGDAEAKADRIVFVPLAFPSFSATMISTWLVRF